jgi:hypothetical protein
LKIQLLVEERERPRGVSPNIAELNTYVHFVLEFIVVQSRCGLTNESLKSDQ